MKVTFVYPDSIGSADYGGIFYLGISMLSSVLKQSGYETSLVHVTQPAAAREIAGRVAVETPDLIAISSTTPMFSLVKDWAREIRQLLPRIPIVVGGVHAILHAEAVISVPEIDFVCVGEGEYALRDLCRALEQHDDVHAIGNIWSKRDGEVIRPPMRLPIADLDELPFADRRLFHYSQLMEAREKMIFVMASRGCPYNCPYCCAESLRKQMSGTGSWVRFRSVDHVIAEIKEALTVHPGTTSIGFYDDILGLRKEWFAEFAHKYKQQINLPFRCNMRANLMSEAIVKQMYEAGCCRVVLGVESGNEQVRNKIIKRNMSEKVLLDAAARVKKYGMELVTNNMIGLPGESPRAVLDTIKINARMNVDYTWTSIFYPFPKTELYEVSAAQGLLTDTVITDFVEGSTLKFDRLTIIRLVFVRNYFRGLMNMYKTIYALPGPLAHGVEALADAVLVSRLTVLSLCVAGNWLFRTVRESKPLAALVKRFRKVI